ncbi:abnormal spindle-like microcephaly-associated protein homolog [Lineus longissimus]|uniref:abnormal spindle-like microcephaly-associated protein homolog n=1 Tax=Lineus longissimus TaxID=88925 RepID=UPI00315CB66A
MTDFENRPPSAELPTPSSRKKGRRSWFTPGRTSMLAMEIKCERNNPVEPTEPEEEEADLLVLSHFTNPPRMDFGKMRPGKSKSKTLILRNPHDYEQEVLIEKFPFKKDFYVDFTRFMVGPEREVHLVISWTPMSEQNCREMVLFQINSVFRLQAYLFGSAVDPPKPRKRKAWKAPFQKVQSHPVRSKAVASVKGMKKPTDRGPQHVLRSVQNVMRSRSEPSMETPKRRPRVSGTKVRASQVHRLSGRKSDDFVSDHREVDKDLHLVQKSLMQGEAKTGCFDLHPALDTQEVSCVPSGIDTNRETFVQVATLSDPPSIGRETFAVVQPLASVERQSEPKVEEVNVPEIKIEELSIMFGDEETECETPVLKENVRSLYTPRSMRRSLTYTKALQLTISPKQRKKLEMSPESVETSEESGIDCTPQVVDSSESFPQDVQSPKSETSELNEFEDSLMLRHSKGDISSSDLCVSVADSESGNVSGRITDCTPVTPNSFLRESAGNLRHSGAPPSSQVPSPDGVLRYMPVTPNSFLKESVGNLRHSDAPHSSQVQSPDGVLCYVPVTPNSFLKESVGNLRHSDAPPSSQVPSPDAVLGSSIPHNVMVKQLETVKTCVQGRLSLGVPASPPQSPCKCSPKPLFTIGTNFPMHSPKGSCMPRLSVDFGHKLVNSGTVTKESKFALSRKPYENTVKSPEDCGISARLFCPSPTTERREIFISPSQLNPASLEIPHTPDLLIRRMTVTKDKPSVLKPNGANSCKRLFPGAVQEDESEPDTFEETIVPQSLHDESIFSSSSGNSEEKSVTESSVSQENSFAPVSRKNWQPPPKKAVNTCRSDVAKSDMVVSERKRNTRHGFTKVQTASVPVASPIRPRRSVNPKPAPKKSPGKRESSPLSKKGPVVKKMKKELAEETQKVPSPNGRKLTRTEQLRIAAAGKKKTVHDKPKTTSIRVRGPVKGVAQGRLVLNRKSETVLPKHPMPFASKNMYYDERWIEKQERGFTRWLNFILTPLDDTEATKQKVDASKLCVDPMKYNDKLAPTKEVLSFRAYTARRKLNNLRRAACRLFQSDAIVTVIQKVEREIEGGRLAVRKDRKLRADLGIKQRILDMVLSYNPLWLRIGLETIYGEILPIQKTTDVVGLSRFVFTRMLENPDIAKEYAHPTVPHLFREGYEEMLAKFTLKKFLMLVFFLDQAKQRRLIDHNPCLFCKDADFKTSRDLLIQFNKDYLSGEGDLTKHLSYLRYNVSHVQTALEEYDFAVTNLALDLRDGLRLTRVVEMLTQNWQLSKSLRAPAISRLQKIHNVEVAFKELTTRGVELEGLRGGRVVPRDVVDGHREKTLGVLWQLIFKFQVDLLIDERQLREEIAFLQNNFRIQRDLAKVSDDLESRYLGLPRDQDAAEQELYFRSERLNLLLKWCKAVCAYYGVSVENFTVSFSDGRALCYIVHHYHPGMLPSRNINHQTMLTHGQRDQDQDESGDESLDGDAPWAGTFSPSTGKPTIYSELLANEKENFKVLYDSVSELGGVPIMVKSTDMSNTIPDEKVVITYVSYLCARLLDIREEARAARTIQAAWRKYWLHSKIKHNRVKLQAIITIQKAWKLYYTRKRAILEGRAVIRLQAVWRGYRIRKLIAEQKQRALLAKQTMAACCIQTYFRSYLTKKKYKQSVAASIRIQSTWRGYWARQQLLRQSTAATIIQEQYRARCAMLQQREHFLQMCNAALVIQTALRQHWARKYATQQRAAVLIQSWWRGHCAVVRFARMRWAAVTLQAFARKNRAQMDFWRMKIAAYKIQQWYRAVRAGREMREEFVLMKNAVVTIQTKVRSWLAKHLETKVRAVVLIQATYRMHRDRLAFLRKRHAAVMIQACYRRHVAVRSYHRMKWAALVIQEKFNALKLQRVCREAFVNNVNAAVTLQAAFRGYMARKAYERLLRTVIRLQAVVRSNISRRRYLKMKEAVRVIEERYSAQRLGYQQWLVFNIQKGAAITIQAAWRGHVIRQEYCNIRSSALVIQSYFRMVKERCEFLRRRAACIIIQNSYRSFLLTKSCQTEFLRMKNAAATIQASFRGWQCRKSLLIKRSAAVCIQKNVRCHQAKLRYICVRNAAVSIQRCYRSVIVARQQKRNCEQVLRSTTTIQANFRGWQCRLKFQKMRSAAIIIQKYVRCLQAKERYEGVKNATVTVQRRWRATVASRKQEQEYCQLRQSIIRIQAHVRCYLAIRTYQEKREACIKIQSVLRGNQQQKKYQKLRAVAVMLQRRFRSFRLSRMQHHEYCAMRSAAVKIQSVARGFLLRRCLMGQNCAAVIVQAAYRSYAAQRRYTTLKRTAWFLQQTLRQTLQMKRQRTEFLQMKHAAILIQAALRGHRMRRHLQRQHQAATTIQAYFRSYKAEKEYLILKMCAISIQRHYRALLATRQQRYEYLIMKGAAITIQACFKGFLVRRHLQWKHEAAVKIQAYYRCYRTQCRYLACRRAAVTIQRRHRALLATKQRRYEYLIMKGAAITIQACFKGYSTRKGLKRQYNAAVLIQTFYRSYQAREQYLAWRNAALTIQRHYRALLVTRHQRHGYLVLRTAVVSIQALFRGYSTRRDLQQQHDATRKIQTSFRRYRARAQYVEFRSAAVTIQRHYRALLVMQNERYDYLVLKGAAMTIQAWYRGYQVRKEVKEMHRAATRIQAWFRAHRACQRYKTCRSAAVIIQRTFRSRLLVKWEREEFVSKRVSACLIQAAFRGHVQRSRFQKMKEAAVKIQACVRMWRAETVYKKTQTAVVVIQEGYRNYVVGKECRRQYRGIRRAACRIQVAVRRFLAKRASQRQAAATKIQASWKMHRCCSSYQKQQQAVMKIQATWRMCLARRAFIRMKSAARVIQRRLRATLLARLVQKDFLVSVGAAITIQASVRAFIARRRYMRSRVLIVNLQARVQSLQKRREFVRLRSTAMLLQCRRRACVQAREECLRFASLKMAAISLQALWRGRQARNRVRRIRAAILIQSVFRMHREQLCYRGCVNLVTRMQAAVRGRIQRAVYRKVTSAVVVIQSWYRGCRTRKEIKEQMKLRAEHLTRVASVLHYNLVAVRIQRCFCRHRALKLAKERMHSVLLIQGWMRARLERLHFLKKRASALKIQAAARLWLKRREQAAVQIQAAVRRWRDRKNKERRMKSANLIQAWYRGHKLRNGIKNVKIHQARKRIAVANREATEDKKLCNRTTSALEYLLVCRQLAAILEALMHLEVATRLSPRCCERMVEDNAVPVLYTLINGCNRSVAHMELIRYTFDILLNLAKYDKTRDGVCVEGAIDTIIHQMQIFLGKGNIFTKACTLLGVLSQDKHRREEIIENKTLKDKILSIHAITTRKHKMKERQQVIKSKMAANNSLLHPTPCKQPKVMSPFWVLRKNKMKEIKEPLPAINFVLNVLHLAPKS